MLAMHQEVDTPNPHADEREKRSAIINEAHQGAFLSLGESAATTFVATVDGLFATYWYGIGLLERRVRGGSIVSGEVTVFELIHIAGNCLRHRHEWEALPAKQLREVAKAIIERLEAVGLRYLDPRIIGKIVEMLPFERYLDFELHTLEVADFLCATAQRYVVNEWAIGNDLNYRIVFGPHDAMHRPILEAHIRERVQKLGKVAKP